MKGLDEARRRYELDDGERETEPECSAPGCYATPGESGLCARHQDEADEDAWVEPDGGRDAR